jgi:hypothetical protein
MKKIRRYRLQNRALTYAKSLVKKHPTVLYEIVQHPYDFGWSIRVWAGDRWAYITY